MKLLALDFDGVICDSAREAFVVAVRRWGMGVWLALAAALLAVLEPQSLDLTHSTMSEALFALLSVAAIACATLSAAYG